MVNVIVPGGCTRTIQTCDVMWNAPLKAYLKESWNEWMREGLKSYTKSSKMRSMSKMQICDSIVSAWDKISPDMIKKSFEICGQVLGFDPDRLLCMREGKSCYGSLPKLKELLELPSERIDLEALKVADTGATIPFEGVYLEEEDEDPLE